ncbi:integrase [Nostoc sp. UHCC 0702]|nr:integrase [Nostoc sp. UHCC 0702]
MSLGVSESPENWKLAELKAKELEADLIFKQFDPANLNKYRIHNLEIIYTSKNIELTIKQLWNKYLKYKSTTLKASTLDYLQKGLGKFIESCPIQDVKRSLEIRDWLLSNTTTSMAKRVLTHLSACVNWGIKNKLISSSNTFQGMSNDLPKHNWEENPEPNAFSEEEKKSILFALQDHKGNWNGKLYTGFAYSHYYPFVKFLFLTGCRPSEAIGLQWKNIKEDCSQITFETSIVRIRGKATRMQGSKNNKVRKFNCNEELQTLLKVHKPLECNPDRLVFPAPKGGAINYGNFCQVAWKKLIEPLIGRSSTPYCCRDTFISEQIAKGVPTAVVARWVDNSVDVIEKRYLDSKLLEQLKPL